MLRDIKHPNVVRLFGVEEVKKDVYIVLEFCDAGSLKDLKNHLKNQMKALGIPEVKGKSGLSEILVFDIFCQICSGMAEVNRQSTVADDIEYMHRDLKLDNIMLTKSNIVKIVDFGLARAIIGEDMYKLEQYSALGTPKYVATELVLFEKYNVNCDVFSVGVIIFELLTGNQLFGEARVPLPCNSRIWWT